MPSVNLLPEELRKKEQPLKQKIPAKIELSTPLPEIQKQNIAPLPRPTQQKVNNEKIIMHLPPENQPPESSVRKQAIEERAKLLSSTQTMPPSSPPPTADTKELRKPRFPAPSALSKTELAKMTLMPDKSSSLATPIISPSPVIFLPLVIALVISISSNGILWFNVRTKALANSRLASQDQNLSSSVNAKETSLQEAFIIQKQMLTAAQLLKNHNYLTPFFAFLENHTLKDIAYLALDLSSGNKISLTILAPNFSLAAGQLLLFTQAKEFISNVEFSTLRHETTEYGEKVRVDVQFTLLPKLLN